MLVEHQGVASSSRDRANEILAPFVPRLVIDWLREEPDALHREVAGSMAFVDISGFTALSERLARRGKIGAELMRDTLNDVFIALLDTAYDYGAGLLKWGGDALLLLFDGPGHELRACRACWEMQRTLERVGRLKAGSSTIVLRMSIGITTGTFQFFLTGSVHRELLVAGPAATETVTMEGIADAGEIAVSHRLAALLDLACIGEPKESALLLKRPPEVEGRRAPDVGDVRGLDLPLCLPLAVRAHVMLERSEPEHRTITAAFIDMMNTDEQLQRLGLHALGEALDERIRTIQEAALKYEVPFYESDVGKSSVKALLTAGAPSTTGHDEERMLRALREIMETPSDIEMRVGVNTGRVFTGDFGPWYRRSYRVFGDAINTAARVMSKAEAGQVLATEIVLDRSQTAFVSTPVEPFAAKGKAEPIRASIVGPVHGRREAEVRDVPFLGREREVEALLRVVEDARQSVGWTVDVSGGPGLGKTRLVQDVLERCRDVFVFRTRCEEYESGTPYFPLRAPFRAVLGVSPADEAATVAARLQVAVATVDPTLTPWVPLLGILLGVEIPDTPETNALDERFIPEKLADVMIRFLYTSLAMTTTALVVEDAQHMDDATRDLVRRLARAGVDRKQLIFVTHDGSGAIFDADDTDDLRVLAFSITPLTPAAAVAMVNAATDDDPLSPHVVDEIARRSAGNPLFLFELIDVVRESGSTEALPDSVEAAVAAQIDRLSPADRTVLRYASVLGTVFNPDLLSVALRDEASLDAEVWLRLGELVETDALSGGLRFRNTLIRDAAYEGLPFRRRRALHERVGEALEAISGDEDPGPIALHYYDAQRWERAWAHCRLAGDRARVIYANVEAARFYERAAAARRRIRSSSASDAAAVYEALGDVQLRLGEFDRASISYRRCRRWLGENSLEQARLMMKEAQAKYRIGAYAQAIRWIERGLRQIEDDNESAAVARRAALHAWKGAIRVFQGRATEATEWCRKAIAEAEESDAQEALAHGSFVLDLALASLGRFDEAVHSPVAVDIYERLGDLDRLGLILNNLGNFAFVHGRWREAEQYWEQAQERWEAAGYRWRAGMAIQNRGELLCEQGRYDAAEPLLHQALRVARASRSDRDIASAATSYGWLCARTSRPEQAHALLTEASGISRRTGAIAELHTAQTWLVECLLSESRWSEALAVADECLSSSGSLDGGFGALERLRVLRGWALLRNAKTDEAQTELRISLTEARARGADHLISLIIDAIVATPDVDDCEALRQERDEIRAQLGIVRAPTF